MKSSDLMLGDWVKAKTVDYVDGVIKYVVENKRATTAMIHQLYNQETGVLKDSLYSIQVEPIELTFAILQKNGFETDGEAIWASFCPEDKDYALEISEPNYYDEKYGERGFWWTVNACEYSIIKLSYIHELQHALKLCGIEKEI